MITSYLLKAADPYAVGQTFGYYGGIVVIIGVAAFFIFKAIFKSRTKK